MMRQNSALVCLAAALWMPCIAAESVPPVIEPITVPARTAEALPEAPILAAAQTLRTWLATETLPERGTPPAAVELPGSGVSVTIRATGRVAGTAWELPPPESSREAGNRAAPDERLRRLAGRAIAAAMDDPALRQAEQQFQLPIGASLYAELEVAGPLRAIAARSWTRLAAQIGPDDGVALRVGERMAVMFPSRIRAMNASDRLEQVLPSLAVDLGLPPRDLGELRQSHGIRVYRFETVHLVQPAPRRAFLRTHGGQIPVPAADPVTPGDPVWFGDRLIDHVLSRLRSDDDAFGLMGDYRPAADIYEPLHATGRDQALVAYGLARLASAAGIADWQRTRLEAAADILLLACADIPRDAASAGRDPVALAAFLLAFETRGAVHDHPLLRAIALESATILRHAADQSQLPARGHTAAIVTAGLRAAHHLFPTMVPQERVDQLLDALLKSGGAEGFADLLPWAGELLLDRFERTREAEDEQRLRDAVLMLRAVQIPVTDDEPVMTGGLNFARGGQVIADAQSLRGGILLARMAGSEAVRDALPAIHAEAVAGTRDLSRFIRQLAVRDDDLWAFRSPHRAIGGIRASLTNSDQPVAAQAMALLFASALLDAAPPE